MARRGTSTHVSGTALAVGSLLLILAVVLGVGHRGSDDEPPVALAPSAEVWAVDGTGLEFGPSGLADLVDEDWSAAVAEATGIPERALRAYAGAEAAFRQEGSECGIDWATLAGIGYVESRHGTLDGGRIDGRGQQSPPIVGIPLDGTATAEVPDTDGGALDGDDIWDRAVGPLQFIPSTWEIVGADGSRDGVADPQNVDDAALAAARYLCGAGDLTVDENWISAVGRYNRSVLYNNAVAGATDRYRQAAGGR